MTGFNVSLGKKVLHFIEANPAQHDQADWMRESDGDCRTTACIAGWTCILGLNLPLRATHSCLGEDPEYYYEEPADTWAVTAASLLNIDTPLARALFTRTTNEEAVRALRRLVEGEAIGTVYEWIMEEPERITGCGCEECEDARLNLLDVP